MGQATSIGNEVKSRMKHPSDMAMLKFKLICDLTHYQLDHGGTPLVVDIHNDIETSVKGCLSALSQINSMRKG